MLNERCKLFGSFKFYRGNKRISDPWGRRLFSAKFSRLEHTGASLLLLSSSSTHDVCVVFTPTIIMGDPVDIAEKRNVPTPRLV